MTLASEQYDILVTALTPLIHSEGSQGNISVFRRQKFVLADGRVVRLPIISGNSARNALRRATMWHMLVVLGYTGENAGKLGAKATNLLLSGGALDRGAVQSQTVDVAGFWRLCELVPPLALFGGGVGNALVPGSLRVGHMIPICEETTVLASCPIEADVMPEGYQPQPIRALMDTWGFSRKDTAGDRKIALLTSGEEVEEKQGRLLKGRKAREEGKQPDKEKSLQMIYESEALAAGSRLSWSVGVQMATEMERECLRTGLAIFSSNPVVAGKAAVGFGRLRLEAKGLTTIDPTRDTEGLALRVGDAYLSHLRDRAADIRTFLEEL